MRGAPAVGDQAGQRAAGGFEVPGEPVGGIRQRRQGAGERRLVIRAGETRLAIEVAEVQRDLVDDLRLARDAQRGQAGAHVRPEIHARPLTRSSRCR